MSKKSKPGDGSYGKGTKGGRHDMDELFQPPAATQRTEDDVPESEEKGQKTDEDN